MIDCLLFLFFNSFIFLPLIWEFSFVCTPYQLAITSCFHCLFHCIRRHSYNWFSQPQSLCLSRNCQYICEFQPFFTLSYGISCLHCTIIASLPLFPPAPPPVLPFSGWSKSHTKGPPSSAVSERISLGRSWKRRQRKPTWTPATTNRTRSPRGPVLPASLATTGQPPLSSREGPYRFLRITPPCTHTHHTFTHPTSLCVGTRCSLAGCSGLFRQSSFFIYLPGLDQRRGILIHRMTWPWRVLDSMTEQRRETGWVELSATYKETVYWFRKYTFHTCCA